MASITPNFNFNGQCYEALKLYQEAFNGKITCLIRNGDVTWETFQRNLPDVEKEYVYHAEMYIENQRIMMCDNLDVGYKPSASLSLTVTMDTKDDVIHAFDIMKEGCEIIYPLHSTAYSSCFVSFYDKFGFRWTIMTEQTEK